MGVDGVLGRLWNRFVGAEGARWSIVEFDEGESASSGFSVDGSYLSLRVSAMRLANRTELLKTFSPFAAFALEIPGSEGKVRSIPIVFDPREKLEQMLNTDDPPDAVPVDDVLILRSLPITFGGFNMLGGLFRRKKGDMGDIVLDILSGLAKVPAASQVSPILDSANIAYQGLTRLLSGPDVQMQVGVYRGFRIPRAGGADSSAAVRKEDQRLLRPGRIGFIAGDAFTSDEVGFEDGRLVLKTGGARRETRELSGLDSLVMSIEAQTRRGDYSALPFHGIWKEVARLIWEDRVEEAKKQRWPQLGGEIALCDALVESEKDDLLNWYLGKFEAEVARRQAFLSPVSHDATRGQGSNRGVETKASAVRRIRQRAEDVKSQFGRASRGPIQANRGQADEVGRGVEEEVRRGLTRLANLISQGRLQLAGKEEGPDFSSPVADELDVIRGSELRKAPIKDKLNCLNLSMYRVGI